MKPEAAAPLVQAPVVSRSNSRAPSSQMRARSLLVHVQFGAVSPSLQQWCNSAHGQFMVCGGRAEVRQLLVLPSTRCCKDAGGQRCCERTLTMRASSGSALFVRRKRRPLVTRGNTHRSTAMRHQTVATRLSGDSAFNVPLFKREEE